MELKKRDLAVLDDLIRAFYYNDSQMKSYKTISEDEKAKIKELMRKGELSSREVGDLKANYIVSHEENIDEDKLLTILKDYGLNDCIKTVEVVDMDALEKAMYDNNVPTAALKKMEKCRVSKEKVSLRVTKKK